MAIPIIETWKRYFMEDRNEGLGSSYERIVINLKLNELIKDFRIQNCVEVPSFGFTGISGINSMWLAKQNLDVHLIDNHRIRVNLIKSVWKEMNLKANIIYQEKLEHLPFSDKEIDFAWNYSSLWFLEDLDLFLKELTRVIRKVIMFCVPNRSGLGYLSQKYLSKLKLKDLLRENFIIPKYFIGKMEENNWRLLDKGFFDCPPWPDIGMSKEEFFKMFGLKFLIPGSSKQNTHFISVLDYYSERDIHFNEKMLKYMWLEKILPSYMKYFWAHHKFFIFVPEGKYEK